MGGGDDLGGKLAEDENHQGEDRRCKEAHRFDPVLGGVGCDEIGDQAGGGDVGNRVAEQEDAEQAVGVGHEAFDELGLFVPRFTAIRAVSEAEKKMERTRKKIRSEIRAAGVCNGLGGSLHGTRIRFG
jgi:hypothetical protein